VGIDVEIVRERRGHWPNAPDHSAVANGMMLISATVAPELTQCSAS
jgi:hypothetical protein